MSTLGENNLKDIPKETSTFGRVSGVGDLVFILI